MKRTALVTSAALSLFLLAACEAPEPDGAGEEESTQSRQEPAGATGEHDSAADSATDAHAHASDEDGRPLLNIMQQLAADMAAMQHALWLEDFGQVENRAHAIAEHPHMSQAEVDRIQTELGPEMSDFLEADEAVHQASVEMHEAARTRDTEAILDRMAEVQRGCVACHEQFRERLRTTPSSQSNP